MMKLVLLAAAVLAMLAAALAVATQVLAGRIERRNPPVGRMVMVDGVAMHVVDEGPRDAPAVLLIHGASGNLRDQIGPARRTLGATHRLIAVDRPGHGWSGRGPGDATPRGQARRIGALMDAIGARDLVVAGHSFGAAITAALALERPDLVRGLLFVAPATHPWPGGRTTWYNHLAVTPVVGALFMRTLAVPAGLMRLADGTACVFSPNRMPERYLAETGIELVLTPARFRANAEDVTGLYEAVRAMAPLYRTITAPTIILSGDRDTVVFEEIHAQGLAHDIPGARLLMVANLGHKPDHAAPELVAGAIRALHGADVDLEALRRAAEAAVAGDAFGPVVRCPQPELPPG